MASLVDDVGLADAIASTGQQISTSINLGVERQERMIADDELLKLIRGAGSKENLLINWYFPNPVNQRAVTGKVTAKGYFIDRWKLISGSVTLSSAGIVLDGVIQQIREFPVGISTVASVLTTVGLLPDDQVEYDDAQKTFQITGHGETLVAAKLEVGDTQSLARLSGSSYVLNNAIPDYTSELSRCQRYYLVLKSYSGTTNAGYPKFGQGYSASATLAYFQTPLPTSMRVSPAVSFSGKIVVEPDNNSVSVTAITNNTLTQNILGLAATSSKLTIGKAVVLQGYNDKTAMIALDANL